MLPGFPCFSKQVPYSAGCSCAGLRDRTVSSGCCLSSPHCAGWFGIFPFSASPVHGWECEGISFQGTVPWGVTGTPELWGSTGNAPRYFRLHVECEPQKVLAQKSFWSKVLNLSETDLEVVWVSSLTKDCSLVFGACPKTSSIFWYHMQRIEQFKKTSIYCSDNWDVRNSVDLEVDYLQIGSFFSPKIK